MTDSTPAPRRRGRPTVLDLGAIAENTYRLWSARGFAATNWTDLAEATGISTRTLQRHFPSRADIAWLGVAPATKRLRTALAATPPQTRLSTTLRQAIVESVSHDPQIQRISPEWLRLISSEPELTAMAPIAYRPWIDVLAAHIGEHLPQAPQALCRALATGYQAATFAALLEWADSGAHGDCADAVDAMLGWLDIHAPTVPDDPAPLPS